MARLSYEELERVKKKYNTNRLWSYSRLNTFWTSPYEYFLSYVLHKKTDRNDCIYAPAGGSFHEILEDLYECHINYEDMIERFEDAWLVHRDISGLKFDRNDIEKDEKICAKYHDNIEHFFKNHKMIKTNMVIEKFLTAKIGNHVLQGYADAITKTEDGNYVIIDWKSSSKYVGKVLEEKSGQLTVYSIALTQLGVPLERIKACFNFLKYASITYTLKSGGTKTKDVERSKIGESLVSNARMWLKHAGYNEDEIDTYLKMLIDANDISVLPEEVASKYEIDDCWVYIPLTEKTVKSWEDKITATIRDIYAREHDYKTDGNDKVFWDSEESVKEQSYYLSTLCGYSANLHLPYKSFIEKLEKEKQSKDLLFDIGNISDTKECIDNDLDLSWLNQI